MVLDTHVLERAELSAFALSGKEGHPAARLFNQLLAMAKFYEAYEIDDHKGSALTEAEVKNARCEQLVSLQRAAFRMDGLQVRRVRGSRSDPSCVEAAPAWSLCPRGGVGCSSV